MAAKAIPTPPQAKPNANEPSVGIPAPATVTAVTSASTTLVPIAMSSADVSAAYRPTTVAPMSSSLPDSSSARVCRTTMMIDSRAISTAPMPPVLTIEMPPSEVGSYTRPYSASSAVVLFAALAADTRDSTDGYRSAAAAAEPAASTTRPATQAGSM